MKMDSSALLPFARLDPISGFSNRHQFIDDYEPGPGEELVMITLADAKRFNQLLRGLGHDYSEAFLRAGAARLREAVNSSVPIYHVSILSFVFIVPLAALEASVQPVVDAFATPLSCGGIPVTTEACIGVVSCDGHDAPSILRAGLAAAQDARDNGMPWSRYNPQTDRAHQRGFLLLTHLADAINDHGQLDLHFQPKIDLATGRISSAEALLRWRHPTLGPISPGEFIPLAENTALINPLTDWVLERALAQAAAWHRAGLRINIAINVSPRNLVRPGFAQYTTALMQKHGVDPATIELEFTEGALAANDSAVIRALKTLRATGARVALDDFGTGFANFSYITHLPADIIKLDKSFIQKIDTDPRSAHVVQSLITLAHRLDYSVVAEGIETQIGYDILRGWKCEEGQGFLMSRPLDVRAFEAAFLPAKVA